MINSELLKSFITAADMGSFSAAARQLGRQQSTISSNIAKLEDDLNVVLFDRKGKYPQVTEAGLALYDSAKLALDSAERFENSAALISAGSPVSLTIAFDEDLPLTPFKDWLQHIHKQYPIMQLKLLRKASIQIFELVKNNQVDLALTPSLESNSSFYEFTAVGHICYMFACSKQHPFRHKRQISNDDLATSTQVVASSMLESQLVQTVAMSSHRWYCEGYDTLLAALQVNIGWAFIAVDQSAPLPEGIVTFKPDFSATHHSAQYDIIWPKNKVLSEIECQLRDQLATVVANLSRH
ncbi:LysR family transcriptional regulator [Photobacterium sanguinicancri]|uniref:LysR family transcriptional regulator n=1 Tax=Photobacterium sanguinicancri TaxID=875932 RepID=UPI0026E34699|nr:LysR family transcriptional regulator [Photobacterium sanguinicancri]MDO6498273.1 LysR family transcriptional regulator [Photobacterium sanguinicancri]